jgi:hypothetical protein
MPELSLSARARKHRSAIIRAAERPFAPRIKVLAQQVADGLCSKRQPSWTLRRIAAITSSASSRCRTCRASRLAHVDPRESGPDALGKGTRSRTDKLVIKPGAPTPAHPARRAPETRGSNVMVAARAAAASKLWPTSDFNI